jgi:Na+/proline symporter
MSPLLIVFFIAAYFGMLILISLRTSRSESNDTFFTGNKKSAWYVVAFGMIGTSISGVTFISVPGEVGFAAAGEHGFRQFSYLQMVLGYVVGYFIIAKVLLPLYYNLNLTSIYTYLEKRFGFWAYKTGAFFFLVSRSIGSALRLFIVANVLQIAVFDHWGIPYAVTVSVTIMLVWLYTFKGGIKTIIWTDTLQTFFLLLAMVMSVWVLASHLDFGFKDLFSEIKNSSYSQVFFWDVDEKKYFFKQFISGIFIAIVMTGLDQDLMQKNLTCRNLKEAQKNMYTFSIVILIVNLIFLCLGSLLYMYATKNGIAIPAKSDDFYPMMAINGYLHPLVGFLFIMGLVAATYASTDSALTALTTSVCVDQKMGSFGNVCADYCDHPDFSCDQ